MKQILYIVMMVCAVLGTTGCKDENSGTQGTGTLSLVLDPKWEITTNGNDSRTGSSYEVPLSDFAITITNQYGELALKFDNYTEIPPEIMLPSGLYRVTARNNVVEGAQFDTPMYYGEALTMVNLGTSSTVNVVCRIAQTKLTIGFSESLLSTLQNVTATVSGTYNSMIDGTTGHIAILNYTTADQLRAGWISSPANGQLKIYISGRNINSGQPVNYTTYLSGVEKCEWRHLDCDIKVSGGLGVDITIEDNLTVLPDIDITVPDDDNIVDGGGEPDVEEGSAPVITGSAFGNESGTSPFDIDAPVEFYTSKHSVLDVLMKSTTGIEKLLLTIESDALADLLEPVLGITGEIDLANPDEGSTWLQMFSDPTIGLIDPDVPIRGKTEHVFAVGGLMELLAAVSVSGASHNFHITVVDSNGSTAKTVTITLHNE